MDHNEFFKRLKAGNLNDLYLFHGEEQYVMSKALEQIKATVEETARDINIHTFKNDSWDEVITACETLPFFSQRRIIICCELPAEQDAEKIIAYLPLKPKSSLLIFVKNGKASPRLSVYKAIEEQGDVVLFDRLKEDEAVKWAMRQARRMGASMDAQAARHLFELTGSDLNNAEKELKKACDFAGREGAVTKDTLDKCVTRNPEYGIFDMLEYFLSGKTADGLRALDFLLSEGEEPMRIASFLTGRFKLMLIGKKLLESGMDYNSAVKALAATTKSRNTYAAGKALESSGKFTDEELADALKAFMDVGFMQIDGVMRDRDTLEMALISLSPQKR
ncbi:MAG: DNA polymerase III subunit delta [Firmicutes bacterium ADurb.Bin182]|nr:MAG: DNA polymerase III subunit delta [Firmicutes bacterium ADurb.Bin182]